MGRHRTGQQETKTVKVTASSYEYFVRVAEMLAREDGKRTVSLTEAVQYVVDSSVIVKEGGKLYGDNVGQVNLDGLVQEYIDETEHQGVETASAEQWEVVKAHLRDFALYVENREEQ